VAHAHAHRAPAGSGLTHARADVAGAAAATTAAKHVNLPGEFAVGLKMHSIAQHSQLALMQECRVDMQQDTPVVGSSCGVQRQMWSLVERRFSCYARSAACSGTHVR
jgi:hypothetical protein